MTIPQVNYAMILIGNKILVQANEKKNDKKFINFKQDSNNLIDNYEQFMLIVYIF